MKIRLQIAAWMIGVGCLSVLIFAGFVFTELQEAYLEMIQTETQRLAQQVAFELHQPVAQDRFASIRQLTAKDWVRIQTLDGQVVYLSEAARRQPLDLPARGENTTLDEAYILAYPSGAWTVYVAREMGELKGETREMQLALLGGLLFTMLFLGGSSYWVAARILRPVREINRLAHDISAQHLDRRIPLPRSQDELYELSQALNQMFDRLEATMQQQRQFLSDASHELKTPTAMLRLFLEQLGRHPELPEALQLRLDGQMQGLLRMERLIKQLLELSSFESRERLPFEIIQINAMLTSLLDEFSPLLEAHELSLSVDLEPDLRLQGHPESLRRMLICLLENAIIYNHPGGSLQVQGSQADAQIQLEIQNTSIAIPPEDLPHLFERFYRVDKSRPLNSGSGLGLAIVHQIVRLHHGSVSITSQQLTCLKLAFPAIQSERLVAGPQAS